MSAILAGLMTAGISGLVYIAGRQAKAQLNEPNPHKFRWVEPEDRDCEIEGCSAYGENQPDFADVWCDGVPCCIQHAVELYEFNEDCAISDPVEELAETWNISYDQAYSMMERGTTLIGLKGLKP